MVLPIKYQALVLHLLHDGQGHWGRTYSCLMPGEILLEYHVPRCSQLCKNCPHCQSAKGDYEDPKRKLGTIIAHNSMDLLCIDFTKVDPSKDGRENILVLTEAFTIFSQAFVTPN